MAIENARDVYTRRMEGVSIWVVESKNIHASNPDEAASMYDPANDKVYRHPTFYNLPDELKHMYLKFPKVKDFGSSFDGILINSFQ